MISVYVLDPIPSIAPPNLILRDLQTEHDADASRMLLTAPLVLSYLILDDMYDFKLTTPGHLLIL